MRHLCGKKEPHPGSRNILATNRCYLLFCGIFVKGGFSNVARRGDKFVTDRVMLPYMLINKLHRGGRTGNFSRNDRDTTFLKISRKPTTNNAQLRLASCSLTPFCVPHNRKRMAVRTTGSDSSDFGFNMGCLACRVSLRAKVAPLSLGTRMTLPYRLVCKTNDRQCSIVGRTVKRKQSIQPKCKRRDSSLEPLVVDAKPQSACGVYFGVDLEQPHLFYATKFLQRLPDALVGG